MKTEESELENQSFRERWYVIIFGTETPTGRLFDITLLWAILLSVLAVVLESVEGIRLQHYTLLLAVEWIFTIVFTLEYLLRLYVVRNRLKYAFSFFGIIDLLAILPTYLSILFASGHFLAVVRVMRLIRVFRVLKLIRYLSEARTLLVALRASLHKITVFLVAVLTVVVIMGTLMYLIEGPEHGFTSIPKGIYWAIVTLSTVGYGDVAPQTTIGQIIACAVMVLGYGIIAVPTGIVSVELHQASRKPTPKRIQCGQCGKAQHEPDAHFCNACGGPL